MIFAAILTALALGAVGHAGFSDSRPPAPSISCARWLNSPPLTLEQLRGKVVLVDFWEYTCINCIRTFSYLRRWNELYAPLGLVVIGVHTPEFEFGRDPKVVAEAVKRFGFTFPIAVDSDRKVWAAFDNEAWPAKYLIDANGRVAFVHIGEGDYASFERKIQRLLKEANPKLDFSAAKYQPPSDGVDASQGRACQFSTPETYLGTQRGERMASPGGYQPLVPADYRLPETLAQDAYALQGVWTAEPQYIVNRAPSGPHQGAVHRGPIKDVSIAAGSSGAGLRLNYRASSVYLVAGAQSGSERLYVMQDGAELPRDSWGVDIRADKLGRTYVELRGKRMYYLVSNPAFGHHVLELTGEGAGVALYSFTFGNDCESAFEHR